jgi:hypothetical protein
MILKPTFQRKSGEVYLCAKQTLLCTNDRRLRCAAGAGFCWCARVVSMHAMTTTAGRMLVAANGGLEDT